MFNLQSSLPLCWCWWSEDSETEVVPVFRLRHQYSLHGLNLRVRPGSSGGQEDQQSPGVQEHLPDDREQHYIWEHISHLVSEQSGPAGTESITQQHHPLLSWIQVSSIEIFKQIKPSINSRDATIVQEFSSGFTGNPNSVEDVKKFLLSYFLSSRRYTYR